VLAIPDSAVIAAGAKQMVYVERGPGMFDGVEVILGPRCGDDYPVVRGLETGQRVASSGAFLIDAETRLNPSLAVGYFGSTATGERRAVPASSPPSEPDAAAKALMKLAPADRALAAHQKTCPVTSEPLGSMGTPIRIMVGGKVVFLCCKGCERELKQDPGKYLAKLHD
jgi:hypothetical protein